MNNNYLNYEYIHDTHKHTHKHFCKKDSAPSNKHGKSATVKQ